MLFLSLYAVQQTKMTKSFKAILLEAFLELDGFRTPPSVEQLCEKSWHVLSGYPFLHKLELPEEERSLHSTHKKWFSYWKKNPVHHSIKADQKTNISWFTNDNGLFGANFTIEDLSETQESNEGIAFVRALNSKYCGRNTCP